ncbi:P-II family nitrogen regulator [Burkholderia sp. IMCC1007]|uniref:P-II family nitrogen regulator n=1 Tax=Burkholderia sp. IMCC1007 TaxID=3004104 RepID=UPI0022B4F657|nr:P-II family nitrogen regulator [Burkholderia sp. IMCC1007]
MRVGALHIHGITVTDVRGFGLHPNYFASDWTTEHIKIEIFTTAENVAGVRKAIIDVAKARSGEDGIVAVVSVEHFWRVRTASESAP